MPGSHGLGAFPWILWVPKAPECRNARVRDALRWVIPRYKGLGQYACWKYELFLLPKALQCVTGHAGAEQAPGDTQALT